MGSNESDQKLAISHWCYYPFPGTEVSTWHALMLNSFNLHSKLTVLFYLLKYVKLHIYKHYYTYKIRVIGKHPNIHILVALMTLECEFQGLL